MENRKYLFIKHFAHHNTGKLFKYDGGCFVHLIGYKDSSLIVEFVDIDRGWTNLKDGKNVLLIPPKYKKSFWYVSISELTPKSD
jgi:hypothetical protein